MPEVICHFCKTSESDFNLLAIKQKNDFIEKLKQLNQEFKESKLRPWIEEKKQIIEKLEKIRIDAHDFLNLKVSTIQSDHTVFFEKVPNLRELFEMALLNSQHYSLPLGETISKLIDINLKLIDETQITKKIEMIETELNSEKIFTFKLIKLSAEKESRNSPSIGEILAFDILDKNNDFWTRIFKIDANPINSILIGYAEVFKNLNYAIANQPFEVFVCPICDEIISRDGRVLTEEIYKIYRSWGSLNPP